jgi:lambda family phage tail tape measure protein
MASIIEIILRGNTTGLQSDMGKAQSIVKNGMDSIASSMASSVAGLVSFGAIASLGNSALQFGDDLAKASEKLGIGAEKLSAMAYAANLSDVSFEALQKGMKFLSKAITEAQVAGTNAAIAFNAMGIVTKDAAGNVKPLDTLFSQVANKFSMMEDGAGKVSLALALFGRAGMDMIPMLNKGAAGIAALEAEAKRLGATVSDRTAKSLEEANDSLKKVWMSVKGTSAALVALPFQMIDAMADSFGRANAAAAELAGNMPFGPDAKTFRAPPAPGKTAAPNIDAIKKAMEERKKLEDDYQKLHVKNVAEEGKLVHDALAAEMGWNQEYFDTGSKMRMEDFAEWKKQQEEEEKLLEKFSMEQIHMLKDLQDAQRAGDALGEWMAAYTAEEAYRAAEAYGNVVLAIQQINSGLGKQWEEIGNGQAIIRSYVNVWATAHQSIQSIMFDLADNAVTKLSDSIAQLVVRGKADFRELANSLIQDMVRMMVASKIVSPLMTGLMGLFTSAPASSGTNLSSGGYSLGGNYTFDKMASGGPVSGGIGYLIGERGPELFVPGSSGSIVPNGGGGSGNVTVNIRNEGGQQVQAKSARASFDGQGMIVDVVIDAINRNVHGLRTVLGGA